MQSKELGLSGNPRLGRHRHNVAEGLSLLFPAHISDSYHGLAEAGKLVSEGHGILMVVNHFSYRDGPGAFVYVASQNEALAGKPWLAPVARHIYDVTKLMNGVFGTHIDLKPVVTASSVKKPKYAHLQRGLGLVDYIKGATRTLRDGGVVVLFPQSTRKPFLGEPEPGDRAMELLLRLTTKPNVEVDDFGILPVGFGVQDAEDYRKLTDVNFRVPYEVNIGRLWLKKEVIESMKESQLSPDAWVIHELRPLVPENYRIPQSGVIF